MTTRAPSPSPSSSRLRTWTTGITSMAAVVALTATVVACTQPTKPEGGTAGPGPSAAPGTTAPPVAPAGGFLESFDGAPASPQPWKPSDWDLTVHSRDDLDNLSPMHAGHGTDCAGPPATHPVDQYEQAVFQCRDHMMTAINAAGYGVVYVTPNQLVDFSGGEAIIRFDVSTLRTSQRDWWDLWITPYEDNLQLPLEEFYPDLNGPPRRAIHVVMTPFNGQAVFRAYRYANFQNQMVEIGGGNVTSVESVVPVSASRRDTFELRISRNRLKFGMPAYNLWWIDDSMPALDWTSGVVQLGHHSYNPTKDCLPGDPCLPNTWHWDNVMISKARPFTLLRGDRRAVTSASQPVTFPSGAPANAHLRFAGLGENLQVSFDGGATWRAAVTQRHYRDVPSDKFASFWMPVPAGTRQVRFRGQAWYGGPWMVRDVSVWAT